MIFLLYGQPASGMTTLGNLLADHLETPFIIDGDEFREMFKNADFGFRGRKKNIRAANTVATYLNKKGKDEGWEAIYVDLDNVRKSHPANKETHVIMCLVNPYKQFREELKQDNEGEVIEILLKSNRELRKEYHVEGFEEGNPDYIIDTNEEMPYTWNRLKGLLKV
jgi:hypothetical protein